MALDNRTRNAAYKTVVFGQQNSLSIVAAAKAFNVPSLNILAGRVAKVQVKLTGVETFVLTIPTWNRVIVPVYNTGQTDIDSIRSKSLISEVLRVKQMSFVFLSDSNTEFKFEPEEIANLVNLGFTYIGGSWEYGLSQDVVIGYKPDLTSNFNRIQLPAQGYTIITRTAKCDLSNWTPLNDVAVWDHVFTVIAENDTPTPFLARATVSGLEPIVTSGGRPLALIKTAAKGTQGRTVYEFNPVPEFVNGSKTGTVTYNVEMRGSFSSRSQWNAGTPLLYGTRESQSLDVIFPLLYMPRASTLSFWNVFPVDRIEESVFVGKARVTVTTNEGVILRGQDIAESTSLVAKVSWNVPLGSPGTEFWIGWDWAEAIARAAAVR